MIIAGDTVLDVKSAAIRLPGKREVNSGIVVSAAAVVHDRIVNALNVAVHVGSHGQCILCLPFLTLVLLPIAFVAAGAATAAIGFAVVFRVSGGAFLVKVSGLLVGFSFVGGFDEFHESSSVFPRKSYDPHA